MVVGFSLSEATATDLLWRHFNPRCNPPWNSSVPSEKKDFERKIKEARRTPGAKPQGWLLNDPNSLRFEDADLLLEIGREIADNLLKPKGTHENTGIDAIEQPVEETVDKLCAWPEEILHPPGLVGEICDWINATAGCYQPILALGAAITACGALFGRKVKDESNGRTNIYAMGVAHSSGWQGSSGKLHRETFPFGGGG